MDYKSPVLAVPNSKELGNYPVKKPEKLLDRILREFGPIL